VWLRDAAGHEVSSSDLVAAEGFTLFADEADASAWGSAASAAATAAGIPVTVVAIGGPSLSDPTGGWAAASETGATGALLVRPDRHVAWRCAQAPADRLRELGEVLHTVLRVSPVIPPGDPLAGLKGIAEAGEALRTGRKREARLFDVHDS
jgi:2,4-dichlorophenol 6-monooxygenase